MKRGAPLKRTPFKRKPAPYPLAALEEALPTVHVPRPVVRPRVRMASNLGAEQPRTPAPAKVPKQARVRQAIRDSANGEECLIRLPGCPQDRAMTIWSHNRHQRAGKGGGIKAIDLNGCYGCTYCDAIYDGQAPRPAGMTRADVELAWYHGHAESLVRLAVKGLL